MFISIWLVSFVQAELVAVKEEFLLGIASRRYNQRGRNSKPMILSIFTPIQCFLEAHMAHHWPKELLIWHCTVISLGQQHS